MKVTSKASTARGSPINEKSCSAKGWVRKNVAMVSILHNIIRVLHVMGAPPREACIGIKKIFLLPSHYDPDNFCS